MPNGSLSLAEYPAAMVRLKCAKCGCEGQSLSLDHVDSHQGLRGRQLGPGLADGAYRQQSHHWLGSVSFPPCPCVLKGVADNALQVFIHAKNGVVACPAESPRRTQETARAFGARLVGPPPSLTVHLSIEQGILS